MNAFGLNLTKMDHVRILFRLAAHGSDVFHRCEHKRCRKLHVRQTGNVRLGCSGCWRTCEHSFFTFVKKVLIFNRASQIC